MYMLYCEISFFVLLFLQCEDVGGWLPERFLCCRFGYGRRWLLVVFVLLGKLWMLAGVATLHCHSRKLWTICVC